MARSSAKANLRAASFAGCQSESLAPRSTSSIIWRSSSKGTRTSMRAFVSRWCTSMPSPGASILRRWPEPTAERTVPDGPRTSTNRRPARERVRVRGVSSSICAHAASETGASSRCRLFMRIVSFQGTDAERTVFRSRRRGRRFNWRRRWRRRGGKRGGRWLIGSDIVEERGGWDKEQISRDRGAEIEDVVVIAGRAADEHIFQHLLDGAWRTAVADEVGAEFAVAWAAERHVVAKNFDFYTVFFDDGKSVVGGGRFD